MSDPDRRPEPDATAPDSCAPDSRAAESAPADGDAAAGAGASHGGGPTVGELTTRIAELEDLRLRALADLDNLRKRCAAQVRNAETEATAREAVQWLPVVDNLERALAHAQADPGSIIEGVKAVRDQAVSVLARLGFPRRDDLGATFDPARHEAIATRSGTDAPAGSVVEVVLPAYGEDGHQLRPARVVVAKADLWPTGISTRSWACHGPPASRRSSGRTGDSRARTIRT
jgi:molecular chaperone GrpE